MVNLAVKFCERSLPVDLVLLSASGPYLAGLPSELRIVNLQSGRLLIGLPKLVAYLKREKPTVVLSAMKHANVTLLLAALLARTRVPVIVSEHNTATVSLAHNPGIKSFVLRLFMKWLYPVANHVVTVSGGVAEDIRHLLRLDARRVSVIFNPIVDTKLLSLVEQPVSNPWLLEKTLPVVLSAGRLTAQKDFETLLRAFSLARQQRPMRLLILGEGELRGELEAIVKSLGLAEDVALPGFIDNPYAYMRHADVFVLSSRWEGFGNVLVEAMTCGTPVISTDCPSGPTEILENGKWGRLVPVGDTESMAKAILDTLNDPGVSPKERGMEFSVERAANAYLELLLPDHERQVTVTEAARSKS
jgi:glycosyltransferase involved in cell wall biosynthesis